MQTILKYHLEITDEQSLFIPPPAILLTVGEQAGGLYVWALVDPNRRPRAVDIYIYGTGNPTSDDPGRYIGTCQMKDGLVWHVFENGYRLS
jgi:hypothetical protein